MPTFLKDFLPAVVIPATLVCVVFVLVASTASQAAEIRLAREDNKGLADIGKSYLKCAMAKIERAYAIDRVPWKRAQSGTETGNYDGFFMATQNGKRDKYAVLSWPFVSFEWTYVVKKGSGITPNDANFTTRGFAVNQSSARHTWLLKQFENKVHSGDIIGSPNSLSSIRMLALGRVDVALENNQNLENVFSGSQVNRSDFDFFVAHVKYAGVYFSKAFLESEPGFLGEFNASLKLCKSG